MVVSKFNDGGVRILNSRYKSLLYLNSLFSDDRSKAVPLLQYFCLCVSVFMCGVRFIVCFSSLLLFVPREGCAS